MSSLIELGGFEMSDGKEEEEFETCEVREEPEAKIGWQSRLAVEDIR